MDGRLVVPRIGEGGMAIVRSATQTSLGREVAVKTLRTTPRSADETPRLLREAWITGALEHPNIVPVHDLGKDADGKPLLVLKRIEGRPWSALIDQPSVIRARFGMDALDWNLQQLGHVCHAIAFAHSRNILHRDLKPQNIMVGGFGEVYVLDWGIAVSLVDDGSGRLPLAADCHDLAGTLAYTNPNAKVDAMGAPVGPTVREGVETHLAKMKKRGRAARSIQTFTHETGKYLADWLDRPFAELTGAKLIELHQQIKDNAAKRVGTNPANDKGAPLANRVIRQVEKLLDPLRRRSSTAPLKHDDATAPAADQLALRRRSSTAPLKQLRGLGQSAG